MLITHYGLDGVRIRTVCCPHPNKYSTFQLSCKELENRKQQRPLRNSTSRSDGFQRFHPISYPQNADSPYSVFWRVLDGVRILDGLQQYPHPNKYSPFRSPCKEIEYKKQQHPLRSSTSRSDGFTRHSSTHWRMKQKHPLQRVLAHLRWGTHTDGLQQYPHPNKYSPFRSPCKEP